MDLIRRYSGACTSALLPLFLIASVLCVCAPASAVGAPKAGGHACCAEGGQTTPNPDRPPHEHRGECNHCGQGQITPGEAASIPVPNVAPVPWMAASAPGVEIGPLPCTTSPRVQSNRNVPHPMGRLLDLKCSLLI